MRYILQGLDCPSCASEIEEELQRVVGLKDSAVNFATRTVEMDPRHCSEAQVAISHVKPDVRLIPADRANENEGRPLRRQVLILSAAVALFIPGLLLYYLRPGIPALVLLISAYALAGQSVIRKAAGSVLRGGRVFDENFLMTVATFGAMALGEIPEAVGVMIFYRTGEYLQSLAVGRSRRSVQALMELRPDHARVVRGGEIEEVAPESVKPGTMIIVHPGERIPLDGKVRDGTSSINTSALTGESTPRSVSAGDEIMAGMLNEDGVLEIEVQREYGRSAVARIMEMVEDAATRKAPAEQFITRFARYYTPTVVFSALALAVIPPLVSPAASFATWSYRALILLVISCPCALVVSIPMGYFAGIGLASRRGILVKGANYLDALNSVSAAIFDKTGTLTDGVFAVRSINPEPGYSESEILAVASAAENHSTHPIASAIRNRAKDAGALRPEAPTDFRERAGRGVQARLGEATIHVGNARLMQEEGIPHPPPPTSGSTVYVARDRELLGTLHIADGIRPSAAGTIRTLGELGISTYMLTGDVADAADQTARELDLRGHWSELLPADKVEMVEKMKESHPQSRVLFAGDGINDAPVIARADLGVAMGGLGTDAAIEAADIVIMDDRLERLLMAFAVARITRRVVTQNVVMALGFKAAILGLGAAGLTTMWGAVFADVGVTLLAVLNSARILRARI
ncbi:MAG: heavy metal translocating P-type ATPase [Bacillota bacterium]